MLVLGDAWPLDGLEITHHHLVPIVTYPAGRGQQDEDR